MKTAIQSHTEAFARLEKAKASLVEAEALAANAQGQHEKEINNAAESGTLSKSALSGCAESSHLVSIASRRIELCKAEVEKATSESNAAFKQAAEFLRIEISRWIAEHQKAENDRLLVGYPKTAQAIEGASRIISQSESVGKGNGISISLFGAINDEHGRMLIDRAKDFLKSHKVS